MSAALAGQLLVGFPAVAGSAPSEGAQKAAARIVLRKTPFGASQWKISARLLRNGHPMAGATLDEQVDLDGWTSVRLKRQTDRQGWVSWRTKAGFPDEARDLPFRIHYAGNSSTEASNSRTYKLPQR